MLRVGFNVTCTHQTIYPPFYKSDIVLQNKHYKKIIKFVELEKWQWLPFITLWGDAMNLL